jgi:hypothetical protein
MTGNRLTDYGRIVHYNATEGYAITWNGGATFNVMVQDGARLNVWHNVDCFTVYDVSTMDEACSVADDHAEGDETVDTLRDMNAGAVAAAWSMERL